MTVLTARGMAQLKKARSMRVTPTATAVAPGSSALKAVNRVAGGEGLDLAAAAIGEGWLGDLGLGLGLAAA